MGDGASDTSADAPETGEDVEAQGSQAKQRRAVDQLISVWVKEGKVEIPVCAHSDPP